MLRASTLCMISFSNVCKQYGGQLLFSGCQSFFLGEGEKVGLVGAQRFGKEHDLPG